jgi:hypothetical protein
LKIVYSTEAASQNYKFMVLLIFIVERVTFIVERVI